MKWSEVTGKIPPNAFLSTMDAIGPKLTVAIRPTSMDRFNEKMAALSPEVRNQLVGTFSIDQFNGMKGAGAVSLGALLPFDAMQAVLPNLSAAVGPNLQQKLFGANLPAWDTTFADSWKLAGPKALGDLPTQVAEQVDEEIDELVRTRFGELSPDQQYLLLVLVCFVSAFGASLATMASPARAKAVGEFGLVVFELLAQINLLAPRDTDR